MPHLTARRPFAAAAPAVASASGERACGVEDCITRLSRYNSSDYCYLHAPVRFPRFRGQFTAEYEAERA